MPGFDSYQKFKEALTSSGCRLCGLADSRTRIVVDRGDPRARVMIVGEAPGKNEDEAGEPFVGRSGKLLDAMLLQLGFDTRRDALVANIAKCRPPDNRPPRPEEAQACLPYLWEQIGWVKPKLVALMGATAMKHIFPEKKGFSMKEQAGRFFEHPAKPGVRWVVLYHPAYILRDPRKRPQMEAHLKRFVEVWKSQ